MISGDTPIPGKGLRPFVYPFGHIADYRDALYRWTLPSKTVAPALDATPAINTSGTFETSVWDAGLPDDQKAFIALTVFTKPSTLDAEHTVAVAFRLDSASAWTSLGTFTGSGAVQTLYFDTISNPETNAVGRSVQLRFTLTSDDTVSPQLYAFALHATLRPSRVRVWEMEVEVGEGVETLPLVPEQSARNTVVTNLESLEAQAYPIELTEDFDWDGAPTTHRVQIVPGTLRLPTPATPDRTQEVWALALQEVTVS